MSKISFCPTTEHQLNELLATGVLSGYGLVIFPTESTGALRGEFLSLPVLVALKATAFTQIPGGLHVYCFGLDPWPEGTTLQLSFEPSRDTDPAELPEMAVGFPMAVRVIRPPGDQAQAS